MSEKKALIETNVYITKEEYQKVVKKMLKKMYIKPLIYALILFLSGLTLLIISLIGSNGFIYVMAVGIPFMAISVIACGFILYSFIMAKKRNNLEFVDTEYKLYPDTFNINQKTNVNEKELTVAYKNLLDVRKDDEFIYLYLAKNRFVFLKNNEDGQKIYEFITKKLTNTK